MVVVDLKSVSEGFLKPALKGVMACGLKDWPSPMTSSPIPAHPCPSTSTSTPASSETPGTDLVSPPPGPSSGAEQESKSLSQGNEESPGAVDKEAGKDHDAAAPRCVTGAQGTAELLSLVDRLAALDSEGWFQVPVTDAQAPGYSSIIKHPMCLQTMRARAQAQAYESWGELVRDFELLCSNAMRYNQKRSRIHKQV